MKKDQLKQKFDALFPSVDKYLADIRSFKLDLGHDIHLYFEIVEEY